MRNVIVTLLLAPVAQSAFCEDRGLPADHLAGVECLGDSLIDALFERASSRTARAEHDAELDEATLGKAGGAQVARTSFRAFPSAAVSRAPARTALLQDRPRFSISHAMAKPRPIGAAIDSRVRQSRLSMVPKATDDFQLPKATPWTMASDNLEALRPELVRPFGKKSPFPASFVSMEAISTTEAGTIYSVVLSLESEEFSFRFMEGQTIAVKTNHDKPEEKPNLMMLSIASSRYGDDQSGRSLSLCVMVKAGRENYFGKLAEGDPVMLAGPFGKGFTLPKVLSKDLVLISVGTGVAPFRAFVRRLFVDDTPLKAEYKAKVTLITTGASRAELPYADEFEAIAAESGGRFVYDASTSGETILGRLEGNAGLAVVETMKSSGHLYIAGPLKSVIDEFGTVLTKYDDEAEGLVKISKAYERWHQEVY